MSILICITGKLATWDIASGECIWEKQFTFSSDGFLFLKDYIVSWNSSIHLWDYETGNLKLTLDEHTKRVNNVSVDNMTLVSASSDKTVKIWDIGKATYKYRYNRLDREWKMYQRL